MGLGLYIGDKEQGFVNQELVISYQSKTGLFNLPKLQSMLLLSIQYESLYYEKTIQVNEGLYLQKQVYTFGLTVL